MNANAYKFGFSGSDNASFYGSYDLNDHLSRMSIGRTNWEYLPMVNVDESVPRSVQIVDTDDHSDAEECSLFLLIFFFVIPSWFFFL